jgi:hypothetical protein
MTHTSRRNASSTSAKVIVWMFVLAAAGLSAHDIVTLFGRIGVAVPFAYLAPVFVDGVTWLGKLMRSRSLSARTNRLGLVYLVAGGSASLAANWLAGDTLGWKILGALAVVGFILGEIALDHIEPRPAPPVKVEADAATRARRSEAARKGAATRRANQAKAKRARRPGITPAVLASLEDSYELPSAPVSPAP